jgi:putative phosphoesterase
MRLLVISDTHGHIKTAVRAWREFGPWDQVVHLGDGLGDAVALAVEIRADVLAVRGNNEGPAAAGSRDELFFQAQGAVLYATHGHLFRLNAWGGQSFETQLSALARWAREGGAEMALFGHTHQPMVRKVEGVWLVNPGAMSLGDPRQTFAELMVEGPGKVSARIIEIEPE